MQLDAGNGWTYPCCIGGELVQNIFADPDEPIRPISIGENCPWVHCHVAYVLLTSGLVPELEAPSYAEFRDRVTADGRHWLRPEVAEFFSSKFLDANREYTEEKKAFVNALMALQYQNRSRPFDLEAAGKAAERALLEKNIRTVAVWGVSMYTDWLIALLQPTAIQVQYLVDPEAAPSPHDRRRLAGSAVPPVLSRYRALPPVDAMIVSDYAHFTEIKGQIPPVYRRLLSLTELAD